MVSMDIFTIGCIDESINLEAFTATLSYDIFFDMSGMTVCSYGRRTAFAAKHP